MSDTIWLDPVGEDKKTVFLQIRNTTDKNIDLESLLASQLMSKGYSVVKNADTAHYWLQTNVLKLDKMDLREAQAFLSSGYGGALSGATAGVLAAGSMNSSNQGMAAAGLVGAAVGLIGDAMIEDVNFSLITDIQITEKQIKPWWPLKKQILKVVTPAVFKPL